MQLMCGQQKKRSLSTEDDCSHVRICKPGTGAGQDAKCLFVLLL